MNILSEVTLACLAIKIFWPLQMRLALKFAAGFIFLQRLFLIVPIVGQLHYLSIVYQSTDPTLKAAYSTLCREIETTLAIIATNIQCFRPFLLATATHYGAPGEEGLSTYGYGAKSDTPVELTDMNNSNVSRSSAQIQSNQRPMATSGDFSPTGRNQFSACVTSGTDQHGDEISICTDDSAKMIIRKNMDYTVQHHEREAGSDEQQENERLKAC